MQHVYFYVDLITFGLSGPTRGASIVSYFTLLFHPYLLVTTAYIGTVVISTIYNTSMVLITYINTYKEQTRANSY